MLSIYALIFFAVSTFSLYTPHQVPAKRFSLDLDLPPEERWMGIMANYARYAPKLRELAEDFRGRLPGYIQPLVDKLVTHMDKSFPEPFPGEMRGVAKALGVNVTDVVLINVLPDLLTFRDCTSIIAQDKTRDIFLARNFDFWNSNTLRKITFIVDFKSKGEIIYSGVTFAGLVGLYTAQSPNALTLDTDQRAQGSIWENIIVALLDKKALPPLFLIRQIVATEGVDFPQAVNELSSAPMFDDSYYIVGGVKPDQGAVVTRNRLSTADVWMLDAEKGSWFLVETNYDHWTTPPPSDDRRDVAIKAMTSIGRGDIDATALLAVLNRFPVKNPDTVYTAVMRAKPSLLEAWIQE